MTEEQENKPPKTLQELGIHFVYMSKDITELKDMIKAHTMMMATKEELRGHDARITKIENTMATEKDSLLRDAKETHEELEQKMVSKTEFKVGMGTITVALSIIVAIITIWNNIRG